MSFPFKSCLCAAVLAVAMPAHARAGEAAALAQKAEDLAAGGQPIEALAAIGGAFDAIWRGLPLNVRKVLFVSREPVGYGVYEPRIDNVFRQDEQLIVYSEPIGFGWEDRAGVYFSDITVDFAILNPAGDVLAEQKSFGRFTYTSRERNSEYMARVNLDITGAGPGSYVLALTYHDQVDNESVSVELPFEIR